MYLHAVFSTKDRIRFLDTPELQSELHSYLGGVSKKVDCQPLIVGGVEDHVHILAAMGRGVSQADWIKEMKRVSSIWMKERHANFGWQSGYGIFSVSVSDIDSIRQYIASQEEHHREVTFQDEFRRLLEEHSLAWDERYVWE